MSVRRFKNVDFNPAPFRELREEARRKFGELSRDWSFVVSIDRAVAFYRMAEGMVRRGEAQRISTTGERIVSDVVCWLDGLPVRVRASMEADGHWIGSAENLKNLDAARPPPRAPRRYRWS